MKTTSKKTTPKPATTKPAAKTQAQAAQIPIMVTRKMRGDLKAKGLTDADIDRLTPAEAWARLGGMPDQATPTDAPPASPSPAALPEDFEALVALAEEEGKPDTRAIEETLMTGVFVSPDLAAKILGETRPNDFFFEAHRAFARAVWPELAEGRHVDRVTLGASLPELPEGDTVKAKERADLLKVADQVFARAKADPPKAGQVEAYLKIFAEGAKLRLAKHLVKQAGEALDRGEVSPAGAAAKVFEIVADLEASRRLVGAFKSEGEAWPAYLAALEAQQDPAHDFLGLDTGFGHLNNVANGLTEGLFILGAAPSTGKTTFAKQLVDQVATLNPQAACLFVSLEQSREELRVKTLSRMSGIENRDILRGRLDTSSAGWSQVTRAADEYQAATAGRVFILEGDKSTTPERIRLAALQVMRATGAAKVFVAIDYLQIVPTEEEYRDPRNRLDAVVSDLRRLARDLHAPVFAVSSVGRVEYDSPSLKSFKESGGIEYAADLGAVMWRNRQDPTDFAQVLGVSREYKRVRLDLVKNRNGERARITFDFYPAVSLFVEADKEALPEGEGD